MTAEEKCETCHFWVCDEPDSAEDREGDCCRRAPSMTWRRAFAGTPHIGESDPLSAVWPSTTPIQWCGEYEAKS